MDVIKLYQRLNRPLVSSKVDTQAPHTKNPGVTTIGLHGSAKVINDN